MFEIGIIFGLLGWLYGTYFIQPGEILGWFPPLLRLTLWGETAIKERTGFRAGLYKGITCPYCFAGWTCIAFGFIEAESCFFHFGAVVVAMATAAFLTKIKWI